MKEPEIHDSFVLRAEIDALTSGAGYLLSNRTRMLDLASEVAAKATRGFVGRPLTEKKSRRAKRKQRRQR